MADTEKTGDKVPLTASDSNAAGEENTSPAADVTPGSANTEGTSEQPIGGTSEKVSEVTNDPEKMPKTKKKGGCSCGCVLRGLIFIITTPILIVLLAVALILWVILLPLKCLCPCLAPCLQCLVDAVFWILHLPIRFLRWVAGKTADDEEELIPEEGKADYGTGQEKQ